MQNLQVMAQKDVESAGYGGRAHQKSDLTPN